MKLNGIDMGDFDIFDVENAEKYENAIELLKDMENIEGGSIAEGIKEQCRIVFDFFNTIYGVGADKKIFGDKVNLLICVRTLGEFMTNVNEQKKEIEKINNKYSPERLKR